MQSWRAGAPATSLEQGVTLSVRANSVNKIVLSKHSGLVHTWGHTASLGHLRLSQTNKLCRHYNPNYSARTTLCPPVKMVLDKIVMLARGAAGPGV